MKKFVLNTYAPISVVSNFKISQKKKKLKLLWLKQYAESRLKAHKKEVYNEHCENEIFR